jgi:hypothetical protein
MLANVLKDMHVGESGGKYAGFVEATSPGQFGWWRELK